MLAALNESAPTATVPAFPGTNRWPSGVGDSAPQVNDMSDTLIGVLFATLASCCWAIGAVLARIAMQRIPAGVATLISLSSGFLVVTGVSLFLYGPGLINVTSTDLLWFVLLALIQFPGGRFLNFNGIRLAGVSTGTAITGSSPLFAALLAALFLKEHLTLFVLAGTTAVVYGLSLVMRERGALEPTATPASALTDAESAARRSRRLGILSALGGAVAYGAAHVLARHIVTTSAPAPVTACYTLLFGAMAMLVASSRSVRWDLLKEPRALVKMGVAGVFSSFGPFFMYLSLARAPVIVVSPIAAIYPLGAMLLTHLFLKRLERVTFRMVCGAGLIVFGVALVIWGNPG